MNADGGDEFHKIYLDYNATTPLAKEVIESITESAIRDWGNPSSSHLYGMTSKKSICEARNVIAKMVNGQSSEIIFTSGGTEANNMIIYGIIQYFKQYYSTDDSTYRPHIITTNVEHDSVILPIMHLTKHLMIDCTIVKVNKGGFVDVEDVISEIRDTTCLITIMHANNETGVIMPISKIGERLRKINEDRGEKMKVLFHTDAAQIIGKEVVDVQELGVDYMTVVGHKFYGPRIGCVWARGPLFPIFRGGGQESRLRPGTENTPMIAGLGTAAELVLRNVDKYKSHMLRVRTALENGLRDAFGEAVVVNCGESERLPNTSNVSFVGDGLEGPLILGNCRHVIASVGAACHGGECSQILLNSGVPMKLAKNALRLSVGRDTTLEDIEKAVSDIQQAVTKLKGELG